MRKYFLNKSLITIVKRLVGYIEDEQAANKLLNKLNDCERYENLEDNLDKIRNPYKHFVETAIATYNIVHAGKYDILSVKVIQRGNNQYLTWNESIILSHLTYGIILRADTCSTGSGESLYMMLMNNIIKYGFSGLIANCEYNRNRILAPVTDKDTDPYFMQQRIEREERFHHG